MKTADISRWRRMRARGPYWFVLVWGVFNWGIGTAVLWTILMSLLSEARGRGDFESNVVSIGIIALALFPVAGLCFGVTVWILNERKYITATREHCASCGYLLRGLHSLRCPECGEAHQLQAQIDQSHDKVE